MPKPRAAYGSKGRKFKGLDIEFGEGLDRFAVDITTAFDELEEDTKVQFGSLINHWTQVYFAGAMSAAIKNTMWLRSQRLYKSVNAEITNVDTGGEHDMAFTVSATLPNDLKDQGITQEMSRPSGVTSAGGGGKSYLVPLATWVSAKGLSGKDRNYMTKAQIIRDLEQPGVFMPKKVFKTKAGPARIIFVYKEGARRKATIKRDKRGRKVTRGTLRQVATAMYLAYKGETGIYGASKAERKIPRKIQTPLASQFGLVDRSSATPSWFTRGAANSLGALYRAIDSVKVSADASGRISRTKGGGKDGEGFDIADIKDSRDIFDEIVERLDDEAKPPSEYEKKFGFR